mmetsp:Transcript_4333/g.27593  ORF Transcript_4333/g.27593 Transcript_4333/m.27593 type:complete len:200 (-) Transcript_4333:1341-1940(-)
MLWIHPGQFSHSSKCVFELPEQQSSVQSRLLFVEMERIPIVHPLAKLQLSPRALGCQGSDLSRVPTASWQEQDRPCVFGRRQFVRFHLQLVHVVLSTFHVSIERVRSDTLGNIHAHVVRPHVCHLAPTWIALHLHDIVQAQKQPCREEQRRCIDQVCESHGRSVVKQTGCNTPNASSMSPWEGWIGEGQDGTHRCDWVR